MRGGGRRGLGDGEGGRWEGGFRRGCQLKSVSEGARRDDFHLESQLHFA